MSSAEPSIPTQPDLSRISSPGDVNQNPSTETALEKEHLENARLAQEVAGLKQDTDERKKYARLFFGLSCAWIVTIIVILLLDGFGWWSFKLSDSVVLATIGSTTVNVLGILYIVANYLFPKKPAVS